MTRLMSLVAIGVALVAGVGAGDDDPVGKKLTEAKKEFVKTAGSARQKVQADLKKRVDSAQKAGDLNALEKATAESDTFEKKAILPKSLPTAGEFQKELKGAREKLEKAYKSAEQDYVKGGKIDEAKAIRAESTQFKLRGTLEGTPPLPGPEKILGDGGVTVQSEAAVTKGLAWLARQQKPGGYWEFDPKDPKTKTKDWATSTGMALLPFLAAGHTHQSDGRYKKDVSDAVTWLKANLNLATGKFAHPSPQYMYSHAIATIALCEVYVRTADPAFKAPAQAAINLIVTAQGANGSWGYQPGTAGDTSITGWQLQALYAAKLGDLTFPPTTVTRAIGFLDRVASGPTRAAYGYAGPNGRPGTSLTAVGLWSRYQFDGWTADSPGLKDGVSGLSVGPLRPKTKEQLKASTASPEMYFFYYAAKVMHGAGGAAWQDWFEGEEVAGKRPGGMRDWLVAVQAGEGGWSADGGTIGSHCGRLGTTAMALLILETPYRYVALEAARPARP